MCIRFLNKRNTNNIESDGVRLFATIEEMQADTTAKENDLAVVYSYTIQNGIATTEFTQINFPDTVVLPSVVTSDYFCMMRSDTGMGDGQIMLRSDEFRFDISSDTGETRIRYTSTDGITYTKTEGDSVVEFENPLKCYYEEEWNDNFGYFMQTGGYDFEGLYRYDGTAWNIANNQFTLTNTNDLISGKAGYGKTGVMTGTLGDNPSDSFADENAQIYAMTQNKYDSMLPKILTDTDKTIDKSMYAIPIRLDGEPLLDTSNVTDMTGMFQKCANLTKIPLLDTSNATNMYEMFGYCTNLITIPLIDTSSVTDMTYMFCECPNLITIPKLNMSSVTKTIYMFLHCTNLTEIPLLDTSSVDDAHGMFNDCPNLTTIPLLDISNATNINEMFSGCLNLTTIPLLDTSNVTNMGFTFNSCKSIITIPELNTSNVTNMGNMLSECINLITIPLIDTSNVTNMAGMFLGCSSLETIPLLVTSNVTNMARMFSDCSSLETIPLIDTSNVTTMYYMFYNCINLTTVPALNTSNITRIDNIFYNCSSLSNDSLNNILTMCTNATKITSKTLKFIGLTEEQANICVTLSNYSAFTSAGWTTGY